MLGNLFISFRILQTNLEHTKLLFFKPIPYKVLVYIPYEYMILIFFCIFFSKFCQKSKIKKSDSEVFNRRHPTSKIRKTFLKILKTLGIVFFFCETNLRFLKMMKTPCNNSTPLRGANNNSTTLRAVSPPIFIGYHKTNIFWKQGVILTI